MRFSSGGFLEVSFYNTAQRAVVPFIPLAEGQVSMYCCGPTVYNYAHIGNLRTYVFEDTLRRVLKDAGYEIYHVLNVTDVGHLTSDGDEGEDKMIQSAREKGMDVWAIAKFFTEAFFQDWEQLSLLKPRVICRATEHIQDMVALIQKLEANGFTYFSQGNLYFDTSLFPDYGKMALVERQTGETVSRVETDTAKKNERDFVLWFTQGKFSDQAMLWESPWGLGYPGWHIECSAMSSKYLGEKFDIHCGGVDHIAVHHTNEIAQSEGAFGHPWVKYWLHGEFLILQKEKMSKSSGEFLTLSALVQKGYDPLDYRYFLLNAHYRTQLAFSWEAMDSARNGRKNLSEKIASMGEGIENPLSFFLNNEVIAEKALIWQRDIRNSLYQDLNLPSALGQVWNMVKDQTTANVEKLQVLGWVNQVFALGFEKVFVKVNIPPEVTELAEERWKAKLEKQWSAADTLRGKIAELGWQMEDNAGGYRLRKMV